MYLSVVRTCPRARRGMVLPLAAVALSIILIFTAFVVDGGYIQVSKTRLQSASDAAALAGAMDLRKTQATVVATIDQYLISNGFNPGEAGNRRTLEYGKWDDEAGNFRVTSFSSANAIRLQIQTASVPSFFGKMLGHSQYTTNADSIVVLGGGPPRDVVVVLDCSGSMNANMSNHKSRMENTIAAAQSLVSNLSEFDRVALATYSWTDSSRSRYQSTGRKRTSLSFNTSTTSSAIAGLNEGGSTNIGGGIRAGLDVFLTDPAPRDAEEPDLVKIMVVMTDGEANQSEPYPYPNDGATGYLPPQPWSNSGYDAFESMQRWANTVKARGIKIYAVKLGGSYNEPFRYTASAPDEYENQYYFHIPTGSEDASQLLKTYEKIGVGKGGPRIVQ